MEIDLSTILFGAWGILLNRFAGQEDVVFGIAEGAAGLLPLRLKINPAAQAEPWLVNVAAQARNAARNRIDDPRQIHLWSGLPADMPLYETAIVCDAQWRGERPALFIEAHLSGESLKLCADYERARFCEDAVVGVLESLAALLTGIALESRRPISELSLINDRQLRKQLIEWNFPQSATLESYLFHRLFEEQVARSPRAPALTFREETLCYEELDGG